MAIGPDSSREEIRQYQTDLNEAGAEPPLVIDGIWGPKTQAAHDEFGDDLATAKDADGTDSALVGTGERNDPRFGIAGGAELWRNTTTGESYIVYMVPGTEDDPVYMRWLVPSDEDVQSFFGPGQPIVYQQEYAGDDPIWADAIDFGSSDDIANTSENPFASWASTLEVEAASAPWLLDDDYQTLLAMSVIEGRPLTQAEIATTNWWKNHTDAEKAWMKMYHGDPATAQQRIDDNRIAVLNMLREAGMSDPDERLVAFIADRATMGQWSQTEMLDQIQILTDPYFEGEGINGDLENYITDNEISITQTSDKEVEVRNIVKQWLGTNFGNWDDEQVSYWAGRLRNEPDAIEALMETLKDQKQVLFPEYDREADYQTIAQPWRTMMRNTWGEVPNDSDATLQKIIKMNDAGEAGKFLTREGLARNNEFVVSSVQGALNQAFGGIEV